MKTLLFSLILIILIALPLRVWPGEPIVKCREDTSYTVEHPAFLNGSRYSDTVGFNIHIICDTISDSTDITDYSHWEWSIPPVPVVVSIAKCDTIIWWGQRTSNDSIFYTDTVRTDIICHCDTIPIDYILVGGIKWRPVVDSECVQRQGQDVWRLNDDNSMPAYGSCLEWRPALRWEVRK